MFSGLNKDKRTPLSAVCSLIYQLLSERTISDEPLFSDLYHYKTTKSGQEKVDDFEFLWKAFTKHAQALSTLTIVIDAMDECENRVAMLNSIIKLQNSLKIKVIIFSRREPDLTRLLDSFLQIRFSKEDSDSDISSFLMSQISSDQILNSTAVKKRVHRRYGVGLTELLLARSNGCFLWATSALKELGRKAKASDILTAVNGLPSDLVELYKSILAGYSERFSVSEKKICSLVLRWLVCAARPLSGVELWAAVRTEYLNSSLEDAADEDPEDVWDDASNNPDDDFLFSRPRIEDICGSLVTVDHGLVQLAHLSIAEFLCQRPSSAEREVWLHDFFVDPRQGHLRITNASIDYMARSLGSPPIQSEDRGSEMYTDDVDEITPLLRYSVYHWPYHLTQSGLQPDVDVTPLKAFMLGPQMLYWLEMWFAIEKRGVWDLEHQLEVMVQWCAHPERLLSPEPSVMTFICQWSKGVSRILERYGTLLERMPSEIHFIDPRSYDGLGEDISIFSDFRSHDPPVHVPHFRLHSQIFAESANPLRDPRPHQKLLLPPHDSHQLALFRVDERRGVIFLASYNTSSPELRCQDLRTARQFRPVRLDCVEQAKRLFFCEGSAINEDRNHIALLYSSIKTKAVDIDLMSTHRYDINIWKLAERLDDGESSKPWCENVKSISIETPFRGCSPYSLHIDHTGRLFCPLGQMTIESSQSELTAYQINATSSIGMFPTVKRVAHLSSISFSADHRFVVAFDSEQRHLVRYSMDDMSLHSQAFVAAQDIMICCISCSGDMVVWRDMGDTITSPKYSCYLQDFGRNRCMRVPGSEVLNFPGHMNLLFTSNEEYLVGNMRTFTNPKCHFLSVWSLQKETLEQTKSENLPAILGLHVTNIDEPAYLATLDRWVQFDASRLDLVLANLDPCKQSRPLTSCKVSKDGNHLALLSIPQQPYTER